jgi:hypothetical protein
MTAVLGIWHVAYMSGANAFDESGIHLSSSSSPSGSAEFSAANSMASPTLFGHLPVTLFPKDKRDVQTQRAVGSFLECSFGELDFGGTPEENEP